MNITLPIYVEESRVQGRLVHTARAVFWPRWVERHEMAARAVSKLAQRVQAHLGELAQQGRHEDLAAYSFYPDDLTDKTTPLRLFLGDRHVAARYFLLTFAALGRRVAFTPTLPDVWFEVARGETLAARAGEVYEHHFRTLERKHGKGTTDPDEFSLNAKTWLAELELRVNVPVLFVKPEDNKFAFFGGDDTAKVNGATELHTVGRCLNWLYPDELDRPAGRGALADELQRLLKARDKRPVLLLGPRGAGKTALLHEVVWRTVAEKRATHAGRGQFWLLAPQRLVAGMSYVGQWEARLLAILREARRQRHVLYFDDLLGLFQAGQAAQSSLSMAQVLKPYLERREVRVVAEMTPEAWRVTQEKDRGWADQFHILRVNEMDEDATLRALISVTRGLERQHECRFQTDALPAVLDLQRRYVREAVFPGKAAAFLQRVARARRNGWVTRAAVLEEFQAQSGLNLTLLDDRATLLRADVLKSLRERVIGQEAALEAAADVLMLAKARLNDTTRPLATMLFLGPTGVGKTHCAKTLANYLSSAGESLLRFDMNEYVSPYAVARLVGTFDQPEGLLTSAIRRQPFAVVLFDEIEKAHPDAFNLLLQVMDDGRLTDALGRTADFSNAVIILTSNLGVRESGLSYGFRPAQTVEGHVFVQAAERFFKPEFFNRLDRIVPFERLQRAEVGHIARHLIQELWQREGLTRRRGKLLLDEKTLDAVVEQGYHPTLGARALKRAIERNITQPLAVQLANLPPETATAVALTSDDKGALHVHAQPIVPLAMEAQPDTRDADVFLDALEDFLDRVDALSQTVKPAGTAAYDASQPAAKRYFVIREHLQRLERMLERADKWLNKPHDAKRAAVWANERQLYRWPSALYEHAADAVTFTDERQIWQPADYFTALLDAGRNAFRTLNEWAAASVPFGATVTDYLSDLAREAALLEALLTDTEAAGLLLLQPLDYAGNTLAHNLATHYARVLEKEVGVNVVRQHPFAFDAMRLHDHARLAVSGPHALALLRGEQGLHARWETHAGTPVLALVSVRVYAVNGGADLSAALRNFATPALDFAALPPVLRFYAPNGGALDFRTGLLSNGNALHDGALRTFMLAGLTAPQELRWEIDL